MAVYTKPVVTNKVPSLPKTVVAKPYTDKNAEIQRTQSVIAERQKAGMDVSAQLSHYQNLTGKSYSAPTTPTTYTAPSNSPQYGFGTIAENNAKKVGYTDKNTEINRTIGVIGNRFNDDMDIASQLAHYKNLTGKDFTKDGRYNELVVTKDVTGKVKAEIEAKTKALKDQLAMQQQASDLAVGQNNAYLSEQIGKMQKQKVVNDDSSIKLQNRRGGFYSGGLDYQLGQNASSYNEASGGLSRDVAQRNADIYAKNSMLASQAAEQISQLQQSAPSLIRERVLQELDRQRGIQMDEAKLTGMYNGSPTFEAQQWNQEYGLKQNAQQLDQMQVMAALTGYLPNGQPTTDQQQRELQNLWLASEQTGVIHPTLAKLYGLPTNTPTYAAKQDAINNAQESARIAVSRSKGPNGQPSNGNPTSSAWNNLKSTDQQRYVDMWNEGDDNTKRWLASQFPEIFSLNQPQPNTGDDYNWEGAMLENLATQQGIVFGKANDTQLRNVVMAIASQEGWDSEQMNEAYNMLKKRNDSSKTDTKKKKTENKEASKKAGEDWLNQKKKSGSGGILG